MYKNKRPLNKLGRKIKRLVSIYGSVELEVYRKSDYDYWSGKQSRPYVIPYGMRYLYNNGNCTIRYWTNIQGFKGKKRQSSCFMDEYSVYENEYGDKIVKRNLIDTIRTMLKHDKGSYRVKYIHAGGRKIKC